MERINRIRTMTTEEMAELIIKLGFTDDYCKSDCPDDDDFSCPHELECCVRWLREEWEKESVE